VGVYTTILKHSIGKDVLITYTRCSQFGDQHMVYIPGSAAGSPYVKVQNGTHVRPKCKDALHVTRIWPLVTWVSANIRLVTEAQHGLYLN
jgi:hypothetical protein